MKYHYQFISPTKVRIELIPEDKRDNLLLDSFGQMEIGENKPLVACFTKGLEAYTKDAVLLKTSFMQYPRVALCSFETAKSKTRQMAL